LRPLVSIITPTFGREEFLAQCLRCVQQQSYPDIEWLILDDSPEPSPLLAGHADSRIGYQHMAGRLSIGEKRNRMIAGARGEFIAHFDDDDYYAPRFLDTMVSSLEGNGADFANLCSWYVYDSRHDFFGFWNLRQTTGLHYLCHADQIRLNNFTAQNNSSLHDNFLGYGFTYVYRKKVWSATNFSAVTWGEDAPFARAAAENFQVLSIADQTALVLHVLHANSSSSCFPQYHLPNFLMPVLFDGYGRICAERSVSAAAT